MKNVPIKSRLLLILGVVSFITASCEKLDEGEKAETDLIGDWITTSASMEMSVEGVDFLQLLVTTVGLSETEAGVIIEEITSDVIESLSAGTISFNEDFTYSSFFDGEHDGGTWAMSSDGKTLTFDAGTDDEDEIIIISLTSSSLVVKLPDETEGLDLDDDQIDETTLVIKIELTLTKES